MPLDLHGFDGLVPDCYSTDLTFDIPATKPVDFPKQINIDLLEHGCGIDKAIALKGQFERVEYTSDFVNYYSATLKSNLVILGNERKLYYFPEVLPEAIKVDLIENIIANYQEDDSNINVPYQSTTMLTNEYERFLPAE